jgi:hypothetical protein
MILQRIAGSQAWDSHNLLTEIRVDRRLPRERGGHILDGARWRDHDAAADLVNPDGIDVESLIGRAVGDRQLPERLQRSIGLYADPSVQGRRARPVVLEADLLMYPFDDERLAGIVGSGRGRGMLRKGGRS